MNKPKITIAVLLLLPIAYLGTPERVLARPRGMPKTFTGEQVFRGLFFGEAPVSQLFPEIWTSERVKYALNSRDRVVELNNLKEAIVNWVKANDPGFMNRFGQEMQSGDHLRVQATLKEASEKGVAAMTALGYVTSDGVSGDLVWVVAWAVAVVVAVVAVIALAVKIDVSGGPLPKRPALGGDTTSKLYEEMLTNAVADRLDPSRPNSAIVAMPFVQ